MATMMLKRSIKTRLSIESLSYNRKTEKEKKKASSGAINHA